MIATKPTPIHPFPARMAPEIALEHCADLEQGATVLDQMTGSGTVLRVAAEQGLQGLGFDMDPLAVLLSKVWTTDVDTQALEAAALGLAEQAQALRVEEAALPWIDEHEETRRFVEFWFGQRQRDDLRRLCCLLDAHNDPVSDVLRVAVSRLIITKERGASLAADVSHSRPHRVYKAEEHDFDVFSMFKRSVRYVAQRLHPDRLKGTARVVEGDARNLGAVEAESVDACITSPPYLNAIDYLRGHRLALVWFGHQIDTLRFIRSESIGAERIPKPDADAALAQALTALIDPEGKLDSRRRRMIDRYALDMHAFLKETHRVLKPDGKAVLVVGNSTHGEVFVENTTIVKVAAERVGFTVASETSREIPPSRRYLPPPVEEDGSDLNKRMRTESVLTLKKG